MSEVPNSHPRKLSLDTREKLVEGYKKGLVAEAGLIAHGRGEAFDYLIDETTQDFAKEATYAACSALILADRPIISCNGNVAALVSEDIIHLTDLINAKIEVNLFYKTQKRMEKIISFLKEKGAKEVLGAKVEKKISGLSSKRSEVSKEGIYKSDVVLVPLEDGDRTEALKKSGKKVITIDLNPLSRTAQYADITIVDNITRAIPFMIKIITENKTSKKNLKEIFDSYNNKKILQRAIEKIKNST